MKWLAASIFALAIALVAGTVILALNLRAHQEPGRDSGAPSNSAAALNEASTPSANTSSSDEITGCPVAVRASRLPRLPLSISQHDAYVELHGLTKQGADIGEDTKYLMNFYSIRRSYGINDNGISWQKEQFRFAAYDICRAEANRDNATMRLKEIELVAMLRSEIMDVFFVVALELGVWPDGFDVQGGNPPPKPTPHAF